MELLKSTKLCNKCNIEKDVSEYHKRSDRPSGIVGTCKDCRKVTHRESRLKSTYGISTEEYDRMLLNQKGTCNICSRECISGRRLAVDHCHKSGKVRALLCTKCNTALGAVNDDEDLLYNMISYLREHKIGLKE